MRYLPQVDEYACSAHGDCEAVERAFLRHARGETIPPQPGAAEAGPPEDVDSSFSLARE